MNRLNIALVSALLLLPLAAAAQVLKIEPAIVDSSSPVEEALRENKGRASTSIEGNGRALAVTYSSSEPIEVYMAPLDENGQFVATDFLYYTLPSSENGDVEIDLTVSPGWRPVTQRWVLHFLSKDKDTHATFTTLTFVPSSVFTVLHAAIGHFMTPEPYTPSSYHVLHGYRIMRAQFSVMFGILTVLVAVLVLIIARSPRKLPSLLAVLIIMTGLYQLRFSVDLLRFTNEHLRGYANGMYDEAGSAYQIAAVLTSLPATPKAVYVCRDGTNYKEKILRYMSYPIRISSEDGDAATAEFAVVMNKREWSLSTRTEKGQTSQTLNCGAVKRPATKVTDFPDGSILYLLQP